MKKCKLLLLIMILMSSCNSDNDNIIIEEQRLTDQIGRVFLDKGEYVTATTDFSDEVAVKTLTNQIWYQSDIYVYDEYNIIKQHENPYYMVFENDNIYYSATDLVALQNEPPEFEYGVENKVLTMREIYRFDNGEIYSTHSGSFDIVAVDETRIILDIPYADYTISLSGLTDEFKLEQAKIRIVWNALKN